MNWPPCTFVDARTLDRILANPNTRTKTGTGALANIGTWTGIRASNGTKNGTGTESYSRTWTLLRTETRTNTVTATRTKTLLQGMIDQ